MAAAAAAARLLQRRLTSLLRRDHSFSPLPQGFTRPSWKPAAFRTLHSQTGSVNGVDHNTTNTDASTESTKICRDGSHIPTKFPELANSHADKFDSKHKALSNLKTSARHDLALIFTCKVCETRSMKTICRESYEKGVVVARCGGCDNLHLIADRLGWFGNPASVEDFLAARGEGVTKGSVDTLNLTLDDVAGAGIHRESSVAMNSASQDSVDTLNLTLNDVAGAGIHSESSETINRASKGSVDTLILTLDDGAGAGIHRGSSEAMN